MRTEEEGCKWVPGVGGEAVLLVGLSTGWAGRAQSSVEPYEPSRVGQRETLQLQERGKASTKMER